MLDSRNNHSKIGKWIATIAMSALLAIVCMSNSYNTQPFIGLCVALLLLSVIGLLYHKSSIQHFRSLILLASLVWFGFIAGGCNCILLHFQGFVLFLIGKSAFWLSFAITISLLILSVIFGPLWCGWICHLGAFQEFIFKQNKWKLLSSEKSQKVLRIIQISAFVALIIWIIVVQRPAFCAYDPFISIFRLKIFNWVGYITLPLLIISSLFIYRPFCRIFCPIGLLLYMVKFLPFATQLKIESCNDCKKCHSSCKLNAIHNKMIKKTCMMCGDCKQTQCKSIII